MFKTTFSKYLTAFIVIILVSFLLLSGIITSIIRSHTTQDKVNKLELVTTLIAERYEKVGVGELGSNADSNLGSSIVTLFPALTLDYDFNLLITDADGVVVLSTLRLNEQNQPATGGNLGSVNLEAFSEKTNEDGQAFLVYNGKIDGVTDTHVLAYALDVATTDGDTRGYVISLASTESEDRLIGVARQAMINASLWVMLAALVAAYFITDRIVHPMKSMTSAAKKFAKGDFSERIAVKGSDEVAELGNAFNNMADSLDNLEKMRNTFLASVSHDLRTPMTTISGYIDGINSGAIPPEEQEHYLNIISGEVHRLSRLVSQILDVSRLDSGDRKFTFDDFDIAEVARLVLISFESKIDNKKLNVDFEADKENMYAYGDKDAVYQVIYNLCHNAIKFADEGGRLIIKLTVREDKRIKFSVYDDGQSMDAEDASRIFDRFYKSDKSRGLDKDGVGLGLYICKSIVDAHEEEINVDVKDGGCEFWFTLKEGHHPTKRKTVE